MSDENRRQANAGSDFLLQLRPPSKEELLCIGSEVHEDGNVRQLRYFGEDTLRRLERSLIWWAIYQLPIPGRIRPYDDLESLEKTIVAGPTFECLSQIPPQTCRLNVAE